MERKPDWWDNSYVPDKLPSKVPDESPPKKLQWVPAGGTTNKPEDFNWDIEEAPMPPPLEDISEEEEEDLLMEDEEELDEAIESAGGGYQEHKYWLADTVKTNPHMQKLIGVDDPATMGLIYAAGLRKIQERECIRGERTKREILSYTKLAQKFQVDHDTLQECCVAGKLRAKTRKRRKKTEKRIVKLNKTSEDEPGVGPSSSQATTEAT